MFEFEPGLILWTSVSFGLLVLLLYRWVLPPLLDLLEQRAKQVADSLAEAEGKRAQAGELLAEQKKQLGQALQKAEQILARAQTEGDKVKSEMVQKAERQAAAVLEQAQRNIEHEKDKALKAVRQETVELVAAAASKLLGKVVTIDEHHRLIEESITGAGNEQN